MSVSFRPSNMLGGMSALKYFKSHLITEFHNVIEQINLGYSITSTLLKSFVIKTPLISLMRKK